MMDGVRDRIDLPCAIHHTPCWNGCRLIDFIFLWGAHLGCLSVEAFGLAVLMTMSPEGLPALQR